jgi:hypothetical protein
MEVGQLEEAEETMRKLWTTVDRMGLKHLLGGTLYMLSNIKAYQGDLGEARSFANRARNTTLDMNDLHFHRFATLYSAVIEHLAMDYALSEQYARAAVAMLEDNPSLQPFAQALIARSLNEQGHAREALSLAELAHSSLERLGGVDDGELTIRLTYAECLRTSSNIPAAMHVLNKAVQRLLRQASTMQTPEWRESFLTRIPENRCILELARLLGISVDAN